MQFDLPMRPEQGFDSVYGLELTELSDERVRATVPVGDHLKQPAGLVHGGVYAAIAESLASFGSAVGTWNDGKIVMGLSNQTSFLRPITEGTIHAVAIRRHGGRTTWIWDVEISDDRDRLCVLTRVTIAVRDRPDGVEPPPGYRAIAETPPGAS